MTEEELMNNSKLNAAIKQYGPAPEINLSKIKNAKAANISKELKEKVQISKIKERKNKFCFSEEEHVKLPTAGFLYKDFDDEELRNGEITIRPMSLADESILGKQKYIKDGTVFTKLLDSCVVNNIDVKRLVPYDVFYLLYYLRKITYGGDYTFTVNCPECGCQYEKTIDISEVDWQELTEEDNAEYIKTIKLPKSKFTITIEVPSLGNEEETKKISKKYEGYDDTILGYIVRTIEVLDDKGEPISPDDYADFFEALPGLDRAEITKAFEKVENMKIPTIKTVCPNQSCGEEDEITIPFDKEFFRY